MKVNIWKLPRRTSERVLERRLEDFGRLYSFRFYGSYAIAEFKHSRDAERAIRKMNDSLFEGVRIRVDEYRSRDRVKGPSTADVCFNCSKKGHWANECRENDWTDKCYLCGDKGHKKRDCKLNKEKENTERGPRKRIDSRSRSRTGSRSSMSRRSKSAHASKKSGSKSASSSKSGDNSHQSHRQIRAKSRSRSRSRSISKSSYSNDDDSRNKRSISSSLEKRRFSSASRSVSRSRSNGEKK